MQFTSRSERLFFFWQEGSKESFSLKCVDHPDGGSTITAKLQIICFHKWSNLEESTGFFCTRDVELLYTSDASMSVPTQFLSPAPLSPSSSEHTQAPHHCAEDAVWAWAPTWPGPKMLAYS